MSDSEDQSHHSGSSSAASGSPSPAPVASTSKAAADPASPQQRKDKDKATLLPASGGMLTTEAKSTATFASLGLLPALCDACTSLGFTAPSQIQEECVPYALEGRDIIGLAQTGSGKTAAFALPILHHLWEDPQGLFAVVLAPTRCVLLPLSPPPAPSS